ncbi:hypothetical protein [Paenibacillus sp. HB172176]|uniref:hypothetical protein n=1 Tax=Paenibacillus sp. HB172176 TaxID=2493690 RepID=UPI00143C3541|nr:hypothetical protein [Paenibacillus sp. HB172176]
MSVLNSFYIQAINVLAAATPTPFPSGTEGDWDANPIGKLREKLAFRWSIFEGLDFLFFLLAVPYTILTVGLLLYSLWGVLKFLWAASKGNKSIGDKAFWIRVAVIVFVCFLLFSGIFWDILESIYTWTSSQDVTG